MTLLDFRADFRNELSDLYTTSECDELFYIFGEKLLNQNKFYIKTNLSDFFSDKDFKLFQKILEDLKTGKPFQYILGETEFYGLNFHLDESVLIPRPETEELLEIAIENIKNCNSKNRFKILDIGTGSGIISIILKKHFPNAEVTAIDYSDKALKIARKNADFHGTKINFIYSDYLNLELKESYDVIISNPPYININEKPEIENSVKNFEPNMALFSPTSDALIFYRKIAKDCEKYLSDDGKFFLEINQKLGIETLNLFNDFNQVQLLKDLSGNDRFVIGKR